jgi:DNA-binding transcriptional MerR regulator
VSPDDTVLVEHVSRRSGVAASALRFYEQRAVIAFAELERLRLGLTSA